MDNENVVAGMSSGSTNNIPGSICRIRTRQYMAEEGHLPAFSRERLANGLLAPRIREGQENQIAEAGAVPRINDPQRTFRSDVQLIPVRTAIEENEWAMTPLLTDLLNPQKIRMAASTLEVLRERQGSGILPFSVLRITDGGRHIYALQIADAEAIQPAGSRPVEFAYWAPQGGYVDIPRRPSGGEPELVFTPGFSGCALVADLLDANTLRIRHVQGGYECQEYNDPKIIHGDGLINVMQYVHYGYHPHESGYRENITGTAFMIFDRLSDAWVIRYQGIIHSPSVKSLEKTTTGFFTKENKVIATVIASVSSCVTHTGSKSCDIPKK